MNKTEPIAERTVYALRKGGDGFQIRLMVGQPYKTESGNWACPVALDGLHESLADIHGESSWQALMLAIRLVKLFLGFFTQDGGKLYWEQGGEELPLNEIFWDEPMSFKPEIPQPDDPLTDEQEALVSSLTVEELSAIDEAILANCSTQFRKVARIVGTVMDLDQFVEKALPDSFYSNRIYTLVESGKLISEGVIGSMRFCEVRLV